MKSLSKSTIFTAIAGVAIFFTACKKDFGNNNTPAIAALSVVNAYAGTDALDFYIGSQKVNNTGLAFGQKLDYLQAYEGSRTTDVTLVGSPTSLLSKSINLKGGVYHSLYIIGNTKETMEYLLLEDNDIPPANTKAKIRFINLSPDAASLSLELTGDTTKFDDKAYKAYTSFKPVSAAKVSFVLKDKATNTVKATLNDVTLDNGKTYTIWSKGLANANTELNKLSIQVTKH